MNLSALIGEIQAEVGVKRDERFGPVTARAVLARLRGLETRVQKPESRSAEDHLFDARSEKMLATLDPRAEPAFRRFLARAIGVAASLGCDYRMISGNRTWAEQDALFAKGPAVTRARGGSSWHNYGIAGDFGVFQNKVYLDGGNSEQRKLAERVHKAVGLIAADAGMTWGGNWKSMVDMPHFQLAGFPASPKAAHRALFLKTGSVL